MHSLKLRRSFMFLSFVLGLLLVTVDAFAGPHVLRQGREKDVLALFAPYGLEVVVANGFKLWSVSIESNKVVVGLRSQGNEDETFSLVHPQDAPNDALQSKSFAMIRSASKTPGIETAVDELWKAIEKNDRGGYWEIPQRDKHDGDGAEVDHGPGKPAIIQAGNALVRVAIDGILGLGLIWVLSILLAIRLLVNAPRWMRFGLPTIVLVGIAVRLEFSPAAFLGAWPWSRLWPNVAAVYEGPWLSAISRSFGQTFYLTDVMGWTNFAYAAAMPLILFSHATYLLRDPRAGMAASFTLALLPQHIRFSRCEDAFVPSLVLTSLAFALIHAWLRDPSKIMRWLAIVGLPFVLYPAYLLRPLNMMFVAVFLAAIAFLHPETAPLKRRIIGASVALAIWLLALPEFIATNEHALKDATSHFSWILGVFTVIVTPDLFVLTNWQATPMILPVLAVIGGVLGWRRGDRRMVVFLCGWLLLFVTAHAYVIEPAMQPRYHLHLVVPFLLLGASAVSDLSRIAPGGLWATFAVLVAAPFLHRHWIRDLHYTEMQEYEFVATARDEIPEGCTIIEYTGTDTRGIELRFARIGDAIRAGNRSQRFRVVPAFAPGVSGQIVPTVDAVLQDPPACLYVYEGLTCSTEPANDACGRLRHRMVATVVKEVYVPLYAYDRRMLTEIKNHQLPVPFTLLRVQAAEGNQNPSNRH